MRSRFWFVGFIRVRVFCAANRRLVHSVSRGFTLNVAGFTPVRVGSFVRSLKSDWFALHAAKGTTRCIGLHHVRRRGAPRGRRFHSGRRLFARAHLGIFGFIRVRMGSLPSG